MADLSEEENKTATPAISDSERVRQAIMGAGTDDAGDDEELDDEEEVIDDDDSSEGEDDDHNDDDSDDDENHDDSGDKKGKKSDPNFRFTQFKGDGKQATYLKNLEDGYINSSQEAIKLKESAEEAETKAKDAEAQLEAIRTAAAKDPEFSKKIIGLLEEASKDAGDSSTQGAKGTTQNSSDNPFQRDAETRWKKENDAEAAAFAKLNPEVLTDPKIRAAVKDEMTLRANYIYEKEGRLAKSGELMELAYRTLGYDIKKEKSENLREKLKDSAAPTRQQGKKKSNTSTKQFSDLTLSIADKMGISKERLVKGTGK